MGGKRGAWWGKRDSWGGRKIVRVCQLQRKVTLSDHFVLRLYPYTCYVDMCEIFADTKRNL